MGHEFESLAIILGLSVAAGLVARLLRQPLIVAFIAIGIAVGPVGFSWVEAGGAIELFAEVGIVVLLFLVGLKLDLRTLRSSGPVAIATGLGQVAFTSIFGFLIALGLGLDVVTALYVAVALTFSSTIIIVKLLGDKGELDQQHGRIAIGFLIVQDIVVIGVMIGLTSFGADSDEPLAQQVALLALKGGGFLGGVALVSRFVLVPLMHRMAQSAELLVLFSVAWALGLAALSGYLGFSTEVGAFVAGVAIATTPYREAVGARLISLRDFLLLFFFIELGAQLDFADAGAQIGQAAVLSLFVLVVNPLIVLIIMGAMGYRKRTSFLAGLTVAQISEFSLILMALGLALGHTTPRSVGLVTMVGVITIGISTYLILYSGPLFERISPLLNIFERRIPISADEQVNGAKVEVILYGLGRYGTRVAEEFLESGLSFLAVESDPQLVGAAAAHGINCVVYGDAESPDFVHTLPLATTPWVLSTIPDPVVNLTLLRALRDAAYPGKIGLTAHNAGDADALRAAGADAVLQPFTDAADHVLALTGHRPPPPPDGRDQAP